jgi:signal transduction protein with GAF and PtsI domain
VELDRVQNIILALEEQTTLATQHLTDAFDELGRSQSRITALEQTVGFMKGAHELLAAEHDPEDLSRIMVAWLSQQIEIERCSLMLADASGQTLRIAAQCGIDPVVAGRVKVRVGQGIAGWVAHNRKPLFVR